MRLFLHYPTLETRQENLSSSPFSYTQVGATQNTLPSTLSRIYNIDRYEAVVGQGQACFQAAKQALQGWIHFDLGWVNIQAPPPTIGLVVPVVVQVLGLWTLNYCKVIYLLDEPRKWGFAYGTLDEHGEMGEERFLIYHCPENNDVRYEILAFSKPKHWLAKLGYPLSRKLQRKFAVESLARVQQFIQTNE